MTFQFQKSKLTFGMSFFIFIHILFSFANSSENPFMDGVKAYQEQKFEAAELNFKEVLEKSPENPVLLFNFGLSQYQLGRPGLALGLWRKAKSLDSNYLPAKNAISFVEEKLFPDTPNSSALSSIFKTLKHLPLNIWLLISLISFFVFSWVVITYGAKQKASINEWPLWNYFLIPIFILSTSLSIILLVDQSQTRATIIEKNILTHTNPSEESPTISELQEGQVVTIEKSYGDWTQVRTLNGAPGWVLQKVLILF